MLMQRRAGTQLGPQAVQPAGGPKPRLAALLYLAGTCSALRLRQRRSLRRDAHPKVLLLWLIGRGRRIEQGRAWPCRTGS